MDVSENRGTLKSSINIGFSILNHPFWGTPIFGNTQIILPNYLPFNDICKETWVERLQEFETRIPPGCARGAFFGQLQGRIPGIQECSMGLGSLLTFFT